jgi:signal transduction histidine kinase
VEAGERPVILLRFRAAPAQASQFHVLNERISALHREIRSRRRAEERLQEQAAELEEMAAELEQTVESLQQQTDEALNARESARAAADRVTTLAEAGAVLVPGADPGETLRQLAAVSVRTLADFCIAYQLDTDGAVRRVGAAHADPEMRPLVQQLLEASGPLAPEAPPRQAMERGEAVLMEAVSTADVDAWAEGAGPRQAMLALQPSSVLFVPLTGRQTLGALSLGRTARRPPFGEEELELAQELARRAALVLENSRLLVEAQQANAAKASFLATMSHELRTPLNAVLGYADLLQLGVAGELNSGQQGHVARVRQAADHLRGIVDEILLFSRMEAGRERLHPAEVDPKELLETVAELMRPAATERGLELRVEAAEGAPIVTDPTRLRQILLNLVANAVKFTRQGSVTMTLERQQGEILVRVSDTGVGIAPENLQAIFDLFWQADAGTTREFGGTGLGLTVTLRLARLLGGDISVSSLPGEGSTFTVRLPVTMPEADPADTRDRGRETVDGAQP